MPQEPVCPSVCWWEESPLSRSDVEETDFAREALNDLKTPAKLDVEYLERDGNEASSGGMRPSGRVRVYRVDSSESKGLYKELDKSGLISDKRL